MNTAKNDQFDPNSTANAEESEYEEPSFLEQVEGFTPVIDVVVRNLDLEAAMVYGRVHRFCQMGDGVCYASKRTIAEKIGVSTRTVRRRIKKLCDKGFLIDRTPDRQNKPHVYQDTGLAVMKQLLAEEAAEAQGPDSGAEGQSVIRGTAGSPGDTTHCQGESDCASHKDSNEDRTENTNHKKQESFSRKSTNVALRRRCDRSNSKKETTPPPQGSGDHDSKTVDLSDDSLAAYRSLLKYGIQRYRAYTIAQTYSPWYIAWWLDWAIEEPASPGLLVTSIESDDPPPYSGFVSFALRQFDEWGVDKHEAPQLAAWGDWLTWNAVKHDAVSTGSDLEESLVHLFRWRSQHFKRPDAELEGTVHVCRYELIQDMYEILTRYDVSVPSVTYDSSSLYKLAEKLARWAMEHGMHDHLEYVRRFVPGLVGQLEQSVSQ